MASARFRAVSCRCGIGLGPMPRR